MSEHLPEEKDRCDSLPDLPPRDLEGADKPCNQIDELINYMRVLNEELSNLVKDPQYQFYEITIDEYRSNKTEEYCRKIFDSSQLAVSRAAIDVGLSVSEFRNYIQFHASNHTAEALDAIGGIYRLPYIQDFYNDINYAQNCLITWKSKCDSEKGSDLPIPTEGQQDNGFSAFLSFIAGSAFAAGSVLPSMGEVWHGLYEYLWGE